MTSLNDFYFRSWQDCFLDNPSRLHGANGTFWLHSGNDLPWIGFDHVWPNSRIPQRQTQSNQNYGRSSFSGQKSVSNLWHICWHNSFLKVAYAIILISNAISIFIYCFRSFGFNTDTPVDDMKLGDNGQSGDSGVGVGGTADGNTRGDKRVSRKRPMASDMSPIMPGSSGISRRRLDFE